MRLLQCALAWLSKHSTCPSCRFELPTDDESYETTRFERLREQTRDGAYFSWFA